MRIPWTAVSQWCNDYGITGEDREDFEYVIEQVDYAYIKYQNDKLEDDKRNREAGRK